MRVVRCGGRRWRELGDLLVADPVGLVGGFPFGGHVLAVFGQLVGGEVTLPGGGAGQYLLCGLPGGVAALAELVKKSQSGQPSTFRLAASSRSLTISAEN